MRYFNVGVDAWGGRPVSENQIVAHCFGDGLGEERCSAHADVVIDRPVELGFVGDAAQVDQDAAGSGVGVEAS